jgi:molybdate transport system permease protein
VDNTALWLTLRLAIGTTAVLGAAGLPLSYWLARSRWRGKFLVESAVALPLVLPPTVLGFYILVAAGPNSPVGRWYEAITGSRLPFTFAGLLVASIVANIPFAVRPFTAAFARIDRRLIEASWCLGESRLRTFWRIVMPLSWPGILTGLTLTFAHTVGEFGVVLMVGGNIPGVTRTLSMVIYDDVQALDYQSAARTSLLLLVFSFAVLCITQMLQPRDTGE